MRLALLSAAFIFLLASFLLVNSDVYFSGDSIENQIKEHYDLNEIYVHYYSGFFNFLICSISALIIVTAERKLEIGGWNYIASGILFNGFIGFGEVVEHFFKPFWHDFFHYFHVYSGFFSLLLLYLGVRLVLASIAGRKTLENKFIIVAAFIFLLILSFLTSIKTTEKWDPRLEVPVMSLLLAPTVLLTILLIYDALKIFQESGFVMVTLTSFAVFAMFLQLVIILGRISDILGNAYFYALTHSLQDVLHVASATNALLFSVTLSMTLGKIKRVEEIIF